VNEVHSTETCQGKTQLDENNLSKAAEQKIDKANKVWGHAKEAVIDAYNQLLEDGWSEREAGKICMKRCTIFSPTTIRTMLPSEAKNQNMVRHKKTPELEQQQEQPTDISVMDQQQPEPEIATNSMQITEDSSHLAGEKQEPVRMPDSGQQEQETDNQKIEKKWKTSEPQQQPQEKQSVQEYGITEIQNIKLTQEVAWLKHVIKERVPRPNGAKSKCVKCKNFGEQIDGPEDKDGYYGKGYLHDDGSVCYLAQAIGMDRAFSNELKNGTESKKAKTSSSTESRKCMGGDYKEGPCEKKAVGEYSAGYWFCTKHMNENIRLNKELGPVINEMLGKSAKAKTSSKKATLASYEEHKQLAVSRGIKSRAKWRELMKDNTDHIPSKYITSRPDAAFAGKEWKGWKAFFSAPQTFEEKQKIAEDVTGKFFKNSTKQEKDNFKTHKKWRQKC
jgi:hypothetical protein